jgi:hypothetical protein
LIDARWVGGNEALDDSFVGLVGFDFGGVRGSVGNDCLGNDVLLGKIGAWLVDDFAVGILLEVELFAETRFDEADAREMLKSVVEMRMVDLKFE